MPGTRVPVVEGIYPGSDRAWLVRAQLTEPDGMCLDYGPSQTSSSCGHRTRGRDGEIVAFSWGSSSTDGAAEGCLAGAVDPEAKGVEVEFDDGEVHSLQPRASTAFDELAFFGDCWTGDRRLETVTSADGAGQRLDQETVPAAPRSGGGR